MKPFDEIQQLRKELDQLNIDIVKQRAESNHYKHAYEELLDKEAFNFALFQFNPFHTVIVDKIGRVMKSNTAKQQSGDRLPNIGDIMYRDYASKHTVDMHSHLLNSIRTGSIKNFPERPYGDRILAITISPFSEGAMIVTRDITVEKKAEQERINLISDLQKALMEIETLRELLPICASCKRIRDDGGYWQEVEEYFRHRDHLDFSHTMCPECAQRMYPDLWKNIQSKGLQGTSTSV